MQIVIGMQIGKVFFNCRIDRAICIYESDRPEETAKKVNYVHEVIYILLPNLDTFHFSIFLPNVCNICNTYVSHFCFI